MRLRYLFHKPTEASIAECALPVSAIQLTATIAMAFQKNYVPWNRQSSQHLRRGGHEKNYVPWNRLCLRSPLPGGRLWLNMTGGL